MRSLIVNGMLRRNSDETSFYKEKRRLHSDRDMCFIRSCFCKDFETRFVKSQKHNKII